MRVLRAGERATKLLGQCLPTGSMLRSASSLLAISRAILYVGENPRESKSSMYPTITSSSSLVSFFKLALQFYCIEVPARR